MNREPLFYNFDFMLKYLLDENGLWLNDPFKEKGYGSPYFGVLLSSNGKSYLPSIALVQDDIKIISHDPLLREISRQKGLKYWTDDEVDGKSVRMKQLDDPRDAAYIAQFVRLNPNRTEYLKAYLYKSQNIENPIVSLIDELYSSIPSWIYEAVQIDFNYRDKKYKPSKQQIEQAMFEKQKIRKDIAGRKQIEENRLRLIEKYRKIYIKKGKDPLLITRDNIEDIFKSDMKRQSEKIQSDKCN